MAEKERPGLVEATLSVRVSDEMRDLINELCYSKIVAKGEEVEVKIDDQTGVVRHALLKGLKQMLDEREGVAICPLCKGSGRATDEDIKRFLGSEL